MTDKLDPVKRALSRDNDDYENRKAELEKSRPDERNAGDLILPEPNRHAPVDKNAEFSKKVYYMPEEFNALRRELEENWNDFFTTVSPFTGTSPAWCMVFDAPQFIGFCNGMTGLAVQFDSGDVANICKTFLNAFRKLRGVSAIQ